MATSLLSAVGGDTYNGLGGYKRPLQSNPTKVPSNLPSFRGVPNQPGKDIRAPAIKSSANHPDRKTNVTIPYARVTPVETPSDIGRLNEGDVAFCSKTRPGIPGYAHARMTRLAGVDALNRWQGPDNWMMKTEDGKYRYILVDSSNVVDDWRNVPFLGEWSLDGVVMSSDEKDSYYSKTRDGNLYNIAIQGPAMVNNGFLDSTLAPNKLTPYNQGQMSRFKQPLGSSYMDHRIEHVGVAKVEAERQFDFRADYRGEHYHLYPLQSFDREVRPMNELYCGLVATEYKLNAVGKKKLRQVASLYKDAEAIKKGKLEAFRLAEMEYRDAVEQLSPLITALEVANVLLADARLQMTKALAERASVESILPPPDQRDELQVEGFKNLEKLVNERSTAVNEAQASAGTAQKAYDAAYAIVALKKPRLEVEEIRKAFAKAEKLVGKRSGNVRAKTAYQKMGWWDDAKSEKMAGAPESFAAFRWVFFTSQQAWALDPDLDEGLLPGEPRNAAKRQKTTSPYDNKVLRMLDFRHMVGAYCLGKVIDCKAGKMPFMEGGPSETGFRVTANVSIEWRDWRALRRQFNSVDSKVQFGDFLSGSKPWTSGTHPDVKNVIFQWPTNFVPGFKGEPEGNPNVPVNMDFLHMADHSTLRGMDYDKEISKRKGGAPKPVDEPKEEPDPPLLPTGEELEDKKDEQPLLPDDDGDDDGIETSNQFDVLALDSTDTPLGAALKASLARQKKRNLSDAVVEARYKDAPELPTLPANPTAEHFRHLSSVASHRLHLLTAPVTFGEARAFLSGAPVSSVARFVQAPPAPPSAEASSEAASNPATGSASASDEASASAAPPAAELPVFQAPSAPAKKRRAGSTDVFSGIFGATDDSPQPLNPAHRSDGAAGSGSTGRSFQRRGKGAGK